MEAGGEKKKKKSVESVGFPEGSHLEGTRRQGFGRRRNKGVRKGVTRQEVELPGGAGGAPPGLSEGGLQGARRRGRELGTLRRETAGMGRPSGRRSEIGVLTQAAGRRDAPTPPPMPVPAAAPRRLRPAPGSPPAPAPPAGPARRRPEDAAGLGGGGGCAVLPPPPAAGSPAASPPTALQPPRDPRERGAHGAVPAVAPPRRSGPAPAGVGGDLPGARGRGGGWGRVSTSALRPHPTAQGAGFFNRFPPGAGGRVTSLWVGTGVRAVGRNPASCAPGL